ncbi:MAG: hypothetical protein Q9M37_00340 [Desulfonauticus sp.]|nr:hypothetical protein [Desulfonauticus sp.]
MKNISSNFLSSPRLMFVSGWAGFPEFFPTFSQNYIFIIPFITHAPEEIILQINKTNPTYLLAWSTGAHIILKHINEITVKQIFLISPFIHFPDFVDTSILDKMELNIKKHPMRILKNFFKKAGFPEIDFHIKKINTKNLIENLAQGLIFLKHSKVDILKLDLNCKKLYLIHSKKDRIIPYLQSDLIAQKLMLPEENVIYIKTNNHYISENELCRIIYEKTNCKFF